MLKIIKPYELVLVLFLFALATIMTISPSPTMTITAVALGIVTVRLIEIRYAKSKVNNYDIENVAETIPRTPETNEPIVKPEEQRDVRDIIMGKLDDGAIEKAVNDKFQPMIDSVVDDLFGNYGDVTKEIKKKLKEQMNPYIEKYDFAQNSVKLEHLLNSIVDNVTKDQTKIIENTRNLMGLDPIDEIKTSELFDKFAEHIGDEIETDKLEIDMDDTPSYVPLTAYMSCDDKESYSQYSERKTLVFTCEEDETLAVTVDIRRWVEGFDKKWRIDSVERPNKEDNSPRLHANTTDITSLETPIANLRDLDDIEVYFLKLYYDRTSIIIDETDIEDEDVEVKAEPEYSVS